MQNPPMARPRGEIRLALLSALAIGQGTARELAMRSGVGNSATMRTLDNMCTAGEVTKPHSVRRNGVKRPVPVYALSESQHNRAEQMPGAALQSALTAWRG